MKTIISFVFVLGLGCSLQAGPRSSSNYSVTTDTADAGGGKSASVNYTHDGSIGLLAGVADIVSSYGTAKAGFLAQLYEVTDLVVSAESPEVNETSTLQLAARQLLDDATFLAVPPTSVAWSMVTGPLTGISAEGLATAGPVFEDTPASVQGIFGGDTGSLNLTVLNTLPDNYGSYAGDGLDDAWQNQYFGPDNPLAAPDADSDGDSQTNLFEFIAGLVPTDPASRFTLRIANVPEQPSQKRITLGPMVEDRSYIVKFHTDLATGSWETLTGTTQIDTDAERTVTDLNATDATKFYKVEITRP